MWEFTAHHVMRPPLWTWARVGENGVPQERSESTFLTYEEAFRDAVEHGLDPRRDPYRRVDEQYHPD